MLLLIVLINCPLLLNIFSLTENAFYNREPITLLSKFPYLYDETWFGNVIFHKLSPWNTVFDTVLPIPLLLTFNGLLYFQIHKANKIRLNLNSSQCNEVNAAQMFLKVAVVLFVCNSCGVAHLFFTQITNKYPHELLYIIYMSTAINSCVNFFIYYNTNKLFKEKFSHVMSGQCKAGSEVQRAFI